MKVPTLMLAFLAGAPLALSADVTQEDLKKMVSGGLSDGVILCYVQAHAPMAKLSAEDVVDLKKAGLSESLLAAVLAVPSPPEKPAPSAALPPDFNGIDPAYSPSAAYDEFWPGDDSGEWGYFYPWYGFGFGYCGVPCFRGFCGNRFRDGCRTRGIFGGHSTFVGHAHGGFGGPRGGSGGGGGGGSSGGGHGGGHR